jgi:hypothetical protein
MRFYSIATKCGRLPSRGPRPCCRLIRSNFAVRASSTQSNGYGKRESLLDDQGLPAFSTLHELQETSCEVYSENDLFGTYSTNTGKFEYLAYKDYARMVQRCRILLKELGKVKE